MRPKCKSWVCFDKFRKFAAKWAQEFSKLIEKWLRKLSLKLATPSRKEKYLQLSLYLSKLGSFWSILDRKQNKVAGGIWFCIPKWILCRWVCTSQLWYYEIFKCNKRLLDLDQFSWWPCMLTTTYMRHMRPESLVFAWTLLRFTRPSWEDLHIT